MLLGVSVLVNISIFLATCSTLCTEVCVHVSNSLAVDQEWTYGLTVHVPVLLHVQYMYMYRYMYMYVQCSVYVCVPPCLLSPCVVLALVFLPNFLPSFLPSTFHQNRSVVLLALKVNYIPFVYTHSTMCVCVCVCGLPTAG